MPASSIEAPASIRKQPLYLPGRRIYSQTEGNKPGLQEEISLFPFSIVEVLRFFMKPGIASAIPLHLGGGVSFRENTISTQPEWIIKGDAIYYIEPLNFTVNENARWGFFEIKLTDEEGEPTGLDFWDSVIDRAAFKEANTKILNKALIQENYSDTAEFPEVSEGYSKWISYKKDAAGNLGALQNVEHLPAQDLSLHSPGSPPIGGFANMEILANSGTWSRDPKIRNIFVFAMGGGGGGSSSSRKDNANTRGAIAGAGGGAGFYSFSFFSITSASLIDVTVGAGGAGGVERTATNGVNEGSSGGSSIVSIDGSVLTGSGGMGGDSEGGGSWFDNFVRNAIGGRGSNNGGDGQAQLALSSQVGYLGGGSGGPGITLDGNNYGGGGHGPASSGTRSIPGDSGQNGVVLIFF